MTMSGFVIAIAIILVLWPLARFVDRRPLADYGLDIDRAWSTESLGQELCQRSTSSELSRLNKQTSHLDRSEAAQDGLCADDVRRAGALRGLFDVKFNICTFFEIRAANIVHVKEHVVVRIVGGNESVAASVIEEINRTVYHCNWLSTLYTGKDSGSCAIMAHHGLGKTGVELHSIRWLVSSRKFFCNSPHTLQMVAY